MKIFNKLNSPVPAWLFALWLAGSMSMVALAAVPLYTGSLSVPAAGNITANELTATTVVCTNGSKVFTSTCSGVSPTFATVTGSAFNDSGLTASLPICTDGSKNLTSTCTGLVTNADLANSSLTIAGTTNQVNVSGCGPVSLGGTCTLSTPQNINTGASPTFAGLTLTGAGLLQAGLDVSGLSGTPAAGHMRIGVSGNAVVFGQGDNTQPFRFTTANGGTDWLDITSTGTNLEGLALTNGTTANFSGLGTFVGLTAGTGTVKGASDGATNSYVPPGYTKAGAALASTFHIVPETCSVANTATTCTVALSGAGTNSGVSGNTGVTVVATVDTSNVNSCSTASVQAVRISGNTITVTLTAAAGANGCPVNVVYIGT